MRKLFALATLILVISIVLSGCAQTEAPPPTEAPKEEKKKEEPKAEAAEGLASLFG
jgi:ribosomal protein L12E/L44/L45/RPP1/RPP2